MTKKKTASTTSDTPASARPNATWIILDQAKFDAMLDDVVLIVLNERERKEREQAAAAAKGEA